MRADVKGPAQEGRAMQGDHSHAHDDRAWHVAAWDPVYHEERCGGADLKWAQFWNIRVNQSEDTVSSWKTIASLQHLPGNYGSAEMERKQ